MKIFNKSHPDYRPVRIRIYKDDTPTPIHEGVTSIRVDQSLKFSFDVNVFFNEEAEFGDIAKYTVRVEQWKSGKGKPIELED